MASDLGSDPSNADEAPPVDPNWEHRIDSIQGAPSIVFKFCGSLCKASLGEAEMAAILRDDGLSELVIHDAQHRPFASLTVRPRRHRDQAFNLMEIAAALLWSHWRWATGPEELRAESLKQIEEYERALAAASAEPPADDPDAIRFKPGKPITGATALVHFDPFREIGETDPSAICDPRTAYERGSTTSDVAAVTCTACLEHIAELGQGALARLVPPGQLQRHAVILPVGRIDLLPQPIQAVLRGGWLELERLMIEHRIQEPAPAEPLPVSLLIERPGEMDEPSASVIAEFVRRCEAAPRLELPQLLSEFGELIPTFYSWAGNLAGGSLHIVLDDGNHDRSSLALCLREAVERGDRAGFALAAALLELHDEELAAVLGADADGNEEGDHG